MFQHGRSSLSRGATPDERALAHIALAPSPELARLESGSIGARDIARACARCLTQPHANVTQDDDAVAHSLHQGLAVTSAVTATSAIKDLLQVLMFLHLLLQFAEKILGLQPQPPQLWQLLWQQPQFEH